jgi:hypothetical protein
MVWAHECCVRFLLDFFAAFIEVPPKECQNGNSFGGSLVKAARFVTGQYNRYQSVTSMLQELKWTSLQQRRQ